MLGQGTLLSVATLLLYFLVDEAKHTLSSLSQLPLTFLPQGLQSESIP